MNQTALKQPREDVKPGADRDDDLLSLEDSAVPHRDALIGMARLLQRATRVGSPAPITEDIYKRLSAPQPGDLVVESSVLYTRDPDKRLKGLGILLEKRAEWWHSDQEWADLLAEEAYGPDDDRPQDEAWYVQYGPSAEDVCRWTNCSFIALPWDWSPRP